MKILNAIHAQGVGGVKQVFDDYNEALQDLGYEVFSLVSDNGNIDHSTNNVFKLKNHSQIFDYIKLIYILFKIRPDVIICHSNRIMRWMKTLKKFTKAKIIAVNHGISFKKSLNCEYIININEQISNMVVDSGHDVNKSFIVENVIKILQKYNRKTIKSPHIIGMYGRIEPRKGFDILIKAAEVLAKKNIDFRLKIGGFEVNDDYGWSQIKDLCKKSKIYDKCDFVGLVKDKQEFFNNVDIFVVPSREEPFGLVILEGFLHSTLVISSNSEGGKLLINDEKDGILFKNEDFADLATKIEKSLNMPEKYGIITKEAYKKIEEKYSLEILSKNLNVILKKI